MHVFAFVFVWIHVGPFPNNKSLTWSKLKTFTDINSLVAQIAQFLFERVENIVGKTEMLAKINPISTCFQKAFSSEYQKLSLCG